MTKKNNQSCSYKSMTYKADLIRLLALSGENGLDSAAEFLGFIKTEETVIEETTQGKSSTEYLFNELSDESEQFTPQAEIGNPLFFRIVEHKSIPAKDVATKKPDWVENANPFEDYIKKGEKINPSLAHNLAPWPRLWPFLKTALGKMRRTSLPDTEKMVDKISRGEWISKLPVKKKHNWAPTCIIVLDFNQNLIPFWDDMNIVAEKIKNLLGGSVKILIITDGPFGKCRQWGNFKYFGKPFVLDNTNIPVLFISDLGLYSRFGNRKKQWENFGKELIKKGIKPVSLVPVPKRLWNEKVSKLFNMIPWDRNINFMKEFNSLNISRGFEEREVDERGKYLLTLLSPAIRVEPQLLRAVRFFLPESEKSDVGAEAEAWLNSAVSASVFGFSFDLEKINDLRNLFKEETDQKLKEKIASKVKEYHSQFSEAVWAEESQNFKLLAGISDKDADGYFSRCVSTALNESYPDHENFINWIKRLKIRQHEDIWNTNEKITALCAFAEKGDFKLPGNVDPRKYAWLNEPEKKEIDLVIKQIGNKLFIFEENKERRIKNFSIGSLVGTLKTNYRNLSMLNVKSEFFKENKKDSDNSFPIPKDYSDKFQIKITTDCDEILIKSLKKPDWAEGIGRENKGLFVILKKTGKRLYWVNPFPEFKRLNYDRLWCPENIFKAMKGHYPEYPTWADKFDYDEFGLFADVNILGITQRFRWIPPGKFMMGSPEDEPERFSDEVLHEVSLTKGYWLADTACTQELWQAVMGKNPSRFKEKNRPVEKVSYKDVLKFMDKLNLSLSELKLRLPTEAEWENACRAGTRTPFSFGEKITTDQVNYNGNDPYNNGKKGDFRDETVEVKSFPCNEWGLYEMHGNVWEWCKDRYGEYLVESVSDPAGSEADDFRVLRGGSWVYGGRNIRSANRNRTRPTSRNNYIGFRLARGE